MMIVKGYFARMDEKQINKSILSGWENYKNTYEAVNGVAQEWAYK